MYREVKVREKFLLVVLYKQQKRSYEDETAGEKM